MKRIVITQNYTQKLPVLLLLFRNGDTKSRKFARKELFEIAKFADLYSESVKAWENTK